jgi:hypothetical protein
LLKQRKLEPSTIYGYKSAFSGYRIGLSLFSAPFLGPKSSASAKQAISINPDGFFGYIQIGAFRPANFDEIFKNVFYVGASTVPGTGLPIPMISSKLVVKRIEKFKFRSAIAQNIPLP